MTKNALQAEALARARTGQSVQNEVTIIKEFVARGIPEADIRPRENVFTYHAWQALGRQVKRGEKAVRVLTWIPTTREKNGEKVDARMPKAAFVFHVSQTEAKSP